MAGTVKKRKVKITIKRKVKKPEAKAALVTRKPSIGGAYNLLITFNPNHPSAAEKEISDVLTRIGEKPKLAATESEGVLKAKVSSARKVVERLHKLCGADPNLFVMTFRYIPIDAWCKADVRQIKLCVKKAAKEIGSGDRWKISIGKRMWKKMDELALVKELTEGIEEGEVELKNPQKTIQVEITGKEAGVSLLLTGETLNINSIKSQS